MRLDDLTGRRFGRLTVIARVPGQRSGSVCWMTKCDCGNTREVLRTNLVSGQTNSCGCLNKEALAKRRHKHGQSQTRTYQSWVMARFRCISSKHPKYPDYGGRGIKMCDRWLNSFENFLADMGERPEGLSLEREDVNGHYEPGNCKWATQSEQSLNRRDRKQYLFDDQWLNLAQLRRHLNLSAHHAEKKAKTLPCRFVGTTTTTTTKGTLP